jgi:probable HAF family extracellular repeat protein
MVRRLRNCYVLIALAISPAISWGAAAWPEYRMIELGNLATSQFPMPSFANGINEAGQVIGSTPASGMFLPPVHGFLWSNGTGMADLVPVGSDSESVAFGVNDFGVAVGYSSNGSTARPTIWSAPGAPQIVGDLPGGTARGQANDVNNSGVVVGMSSAATGNRAFRWTLGGGIENLGDLPGGADVSEALAINNAGEIVGVSGAAAGERAFRLSPTSAMTALGPLAGDEQSRANAINAGGLVVGESRDLLGGGFYSEHAVLWGSSGAPQFLGHLGEGRSVAFGINDLGHVVGRSFDASGLARGFLWDEALGMTALDDLVVNPDPLYRIFEARAINNSGRIAAWAFSPLDVSAILLVPVPEPGTFGLAVLSVVAIVARRRRR